MPVERWRDRKLVLKQNSTRLVNVGNQALCAAGLLNSHNRRCFAIDLERAGDSLQFRRRYPRRFNGAFGMRRRNFCCQEMQWWHRLQLTPESNGARIPGLTVILPRFMVSNLAEARRIGQFT